MNSAKNTHYVIAMLLIGQFVQSSMATTIEWEVASGAFDVSANWNPDAVFSDSNVDEYYMSNGGDATLANGVVLGASTVSVGQNDGATASMLTVQNGGNLGVSDFRVALGNGQIGTSQVTIQSGGTVTTANASIGQQSAGSLTINSGGVFSHSGDLRLGNTASANGLIVNSGSYSSPNAIILSENGGTSKFTNGGGTTSARVLDMNNGGSATLEMNGSVGSFTLTGIGTSLAAGSATSSLNWIFDGGGVVSLSLSGLNAVADISNANLNLNLDAVAAGTYTLIDNLNGGSISGAGTASISYLGSTLGTVFEQDGDLLISVIPEPSTLPLILLGGMGLFLRNSRRK